MPTSGLVGNTEADLESRLIAGLGVAFPNIPPGELQQQRRFTVQLGHQTHTFDSAASWATSGRADILISHQENPLAVIEVKHQDLAVTHSDYKQAQSYANQLTPRPPLVVVTNGSKTDVYDSSTGEPWSDEGDEAGAVGHLLTNAARVAAADMRWAIEALMGQESGVWVPVVRASTDLLLAEMTDKPGESQRPFAKDLLFPRMATQRATQALLHGPAFTIVGGAPLSGKTTLLRELAIRTRESDELALLTLRGQGPGLFQALANLFATELEWNLTASDVRHWLRRTSMGSDGPILVLGIDAVDSETPMAADLQELASLPPGDILRVVFNSDCPERLVRTRNGRTLTGLGTHGTSVDLGPPGLEEFSAARGVLAENRILLTDGSEYTADYRAPWVLRTIYDQVAADPRYADSTQGVMLPASLGLDPVEAGRHSDASQPDLLRGYRLLARAALADSNAAAAELALFGSNAFVLRHDALSPAAREALTQLSAAARARTARLASGHHIVVTTIPGVYLAELAACAGVELERRADEDPYAAGVWLAQRFDGVYLGDIVGAQAIRRMAERVGDFSSGIVHGLLSVKPEEELVERAFIGMANSQGDVIHIKIEDGKAWISDRSGVALGEPVDLGAERSRMYRNMTGWMILAQLARLPTAAVGDDSDRMDASILLEIGGCPFPLMRADEGGVGSFGV